VRLASQLRTAAEAMRRTFVIVINLASATKIHAELVEATIVAFDASVVA